MKRLLALLLTITCLIPSALAEEQTIQADRIDSILRNFKTIGGAVLVARDGEILYEHYYGFADIRSPRAVTADTYFRSASITKFVTGIGVMQMVEEGLLSLDADISGALGMPVKNPYFPDRPVTLRQLMSHTSGVKETGGFSALSSTLRSMLVKQPRKNFTQNAPGEAYAYSNFGAGIVGAMMEGVSGQSVNRIMTERVFAPLHIDAAYAAAMLAKPENIAAQYKNGRTDVSVRAARAVVYEDAADPDKHYRSTVGALWIRPRDLMKLTIAMANDGTVDGVRLLKPETVALMRANQADLSASVAAVNSPYGLFTARADNLLPGKLLYGHHGSSSGFACSTYYEPETGFAFVLMTNGCDQRRDDRITLITRRLMTYLYPLVVR